MELIAIVVCVILVALLALRTFGGQISNTTNETTNTVENLTSTVLNGSGSGGSGGSGSGNSNAPYQNYEMQYWETGDFNSENPQNRVLMCWFKHKADDYEPTFAELTINGKVENITITSSTSAEWTIYYLSFTDEDLLVKWTESSSIVFDGQLIQFESSLYWDN